MTRGRPAAGNDSADPTTKLAAVPGEAPAPEKTASRSAAEPPAAGIAGPDPECSRSSIPLALAVVTPSNLTRTRGGKVATAL